MTYELNQEMLEHLNDILSMIIAFDSKGNIIYASGETKEALQYGEDIDGINIKTIFPSVSGEVDNFTEFIGKTYGEDEYFNAYRKNGTCFPVKFKIAKLNDRYIMRILDMQQEVKWKHLYETAEIESKAALSKQNEFVANVTHELRTPVNGIKGHVTFLKEQDNLTKEQHNTLKIITRCCENMEKIINDLLDFAKIDAGRISIEKEKFSFREMMNQVRDTNIKQANQKGISLFVEVDESIPDTLYGDSLRIGQILNNFISNAVKFTSVGYVRVEVVEISRTSNTIELFFMIIDTGIGIAKENLDKLFKSFSQVDGSITRTYGGTGLGLAISKQLVRMMNGSIKVESELGKGSTFAFSVVIGLSPEVLEDEILYSDKTEKETDNRTETLQDKFNNIINNVERNNITNVFEWGTDENKAELNDTLSKLILCVEMDNWEKAELFTDKIKELASGGDMNIKKQLFRLQMAVRKGSREQSITEYNEFLNTMNEE